MTKSKSTDNKIIKDLFLIKKPDKFYLISEEMITTLSLDEVFYLWNLARKEQAKQFLIDALSSEHVIDNIKVVEGLEKTLQKMEEIFPGLSLRFRILNKTKKQPN